MEWCRRGQSDLPQLKLVSSKRRAVEETPQRNSNHEKTLPAHSQSAYLPRRAIWLFVSPSVCGERPSTGSRTLGLEEPNCPRSTAGGGCTSGFLRIRGRQ